MKLFISVLIVFVFSSSCKTQTGKTSNSTIAGKAPMIATKQQLVFDTAFKTIHVLVALCDNQYQGIVPVPAKIGNGRDLNNNLYWGCGYGIRSYFKNSRQWKLVKQYVLNDTLMERLVFKSTEGNYYLVADAYNGKYIRECTIGFFSSCSGAVKDTLQLNGTAIGINGNAALLAYIGHDGLMDFSLPQSFNNVDGKKREAIMLACISKKYFARKLAETGAHPLVWSTGLMSPEAYTLHDALAAYVNQQGSAAVQQAAAKAYSRYQKCSIRAAENLLISGW
jgi:hypothetical protein